MDRMMMLPFGWKNKITNVGIRQKTKQTQQHWDPIINKTTKTALLEPLASLIYLGARCFGPFVTIREILPSDELFYHGIVTASPTDGSNNGAILSLEEKGMEDEQGQRRGLV
mmetsp:Transcript_37506/g.55855  ORF Transcript_37506/g.55855 Transcript_37506/m.55855 type:complete len:112 (-) Transcript_37506:266-601(-)